MQECRTITEQHTYAVQKEIWNKNKMFQGVGFNTLTRGSYKGVLIPLGSAESFSRIFEF